MLWAALVYCFGVLCAALGCSGALWRAVGRSGALWGARPDVQSDWQISMNTFPVSVAPRKFERLGQCVLLFTIHSRSDVKLYCYLQYIARGWPNLYCYLQYIRAPTLNCIVIYNRFRTADILEGVRVYINKNQR